MRLEIRTAGQCRPVGFRSPFPARQLRWHGRDGCLAIDAGYGPSQPEDWSEKIYSRLFRVELGPPLAPADDVLITHYHLDHVGGVGDVACSGPPPPTLGGKLWQLHHATFARAIPRNITPLPPWTHQRWGFDAVAWHDLEVLHLPGHTLDHTGVYFPALHLLYVCDAVWFLSWLSAGRAPWWAVRLQENPRRYRQTLRKLHAAARADPTLRFRCAHDPAQARDEDLSV